MEFSWADKIVLLAFIPFAIYLYRPNLIGIDAYSYLMQAEAIGLNIVLIKLLMMLALIASLFAIASLGLVFDKKNGWKAGIYAMLSPVLVFEFAKFETEFIAYTFLFWALALFYWGQAQEFKAKIASRLLIIAILLIAAGFWGGSLYFFFALALGSVIMALTTIPIAYSFGARLVQSAMPFYPLPWENRPVIGFAYLWILALGYANPIKKMLPQLAFFTALMLLNFRFTVFVIPFLAVSLMLLMEKPKAKQFQSLVIAFAFISAAGWGITLHFQPPSQNQLDAIAYAIGSAQGASIENDWDLGYWVQWLGGSTEHFAGGPEFTSFKKEGIVLTKQDLNCPVLREFGYLTVYDCK